MIARSAVHFVVPGDLADATGGYVYDRQMIAGLRTLGWPIIVHRLDGEFPWPDAQALRAARAQLAGVPSGAAVLIDGLALGALPRIVQAEAARLKLAALIHLPLGAAPGLPAAEAERLRASERSALQAVARVIVTSTLGARLLRQSGVDGSRLAVIEPGVPEAPVATPTSSAELRLLCVATVCAAKGQELLIEALAGLRALRWRLTCVGSLEREPRTVERLRTRLRELHLCERVQLVGAVEHAALGRYFLDADLFVLPTHFETYCMAVAEALAHGLPVLSTSTGAIPELIGGQAGLLVSPGDGKGIQVALERLLVDRSLLASFRAGASAARARLPRWPQVCGRLSALLQEWLAEPSPD